MKLYWRLKKKGKWTWAPANVIDHVVIDGDDHVCIRGKPDEEE